MATTMGQALAERIRYQTTNGEKVLQAAGLGTENDHTDAVFGPPRSVLSVRGNVSDVAHTNHLWLLDAVAAGALSAELAGALRRLRPQSIEDAVDFLAPRDTDTAEQALAHLKLVNDAIASGVEKLSDEQLEKKVEVTFYGTKTLRDVMFIVIEHGAL